MAQKSSFSLINIILGTKCNLSCDHCVIQSSPKRKERLTNEDYDLLVKEISTINTEMIIFTGGEPFLHLEIMEDLIRRLKKSGYLGRFGLTTNGIAAKNKFTIDEFCKKFVDISLIQLSFDTAHKQKYIDKIIKNLQECSDLYEIEICILAAIKDPMEMVQLSTVKEKYKIDLIYQKASLVGKAKLTGHYFKHTTAPNRLENIKCPAVGSLTYMADKGFSQCCSSLLFDWNTNEHYSKNLNKYLNSNSYSLLKSGNLTDVANKLKVDLNPVVPEFNDPCFLCEYIFNQYNSRGN